MLEKRNWVCVLSLSFIYLTSCCCLKTKTVGQKVNVQQVTLQKIIPGEINQAEYWEIRWMSHDVGFKAVYYGDYSGLINKSSEDKYNTKLYLNQLSISKKLKKLLTKQPLVLEIIDQKGKHYEFIEKFNILDPIYLPSEKAND
jgi:hypothetical protein